MNSINWARILAQIVYYVHAYLKVTDAPAAGAAAPKVSFSVPTGNFGDILAGFYAKEMGLPVERLIVATNSNDILHRYFSAGDYSSSGVAETVTPSMDIAVSSNFERFLFHMSGNDSAMMAKLMGELESNGTRHAPPATRHPVHNAAPPRPLHAALPHPQEIRDRYIVGFHDAHDSRRLSYLSEIDR